MAQNNISVGIDVGSTKIITCVGKFENGITDIIGVGRSVNQGISKGVIVDIEETVSAISSSLEEAERMAGFPIQSAIIGISGAHIESEDSKGKNNCHKKNCCFKPGYIENKCQNAYQYCKNSMYSGILF